MTGRNEPCPCGSGKKFKRCCGVGAEPILGKPSAPDPNSVAGELQGMDPNQMDPEMIQKMQQALAKLPKGQMKQLQSVMKKAMAGKDVTSEMAALQKRLPPGFMDAMNTVEEQPLTVDEAKKTVQEAMEKGEISEEEGRKLLEATPDSEGQGGSVEKKKSFWSKFKSSLGKGT